MKRKAGGLAQTVAQGIERDIEARATGVLPTVTELARLHRVSRTTVILALRSLKEKGVLAQGDRRRPTVAVRAGERVGPRLKGVALVASTVLRQITEGAIGAGDPLPKIAACARSLGVSQSTVCKALADLAQRSVVHKHGKSWIAGRTPRSNQGGSRAGSPPVIVLLCTGEHAWRALYNNRTQAFAEAFETQARRSGLQLRNALTDVSAMNRAGLPAGPRQVEKFITDLGDRYRGVVLVDFDLTFVAAGQRPTVDGEFTAWASLLRRHKRPIVWLDRHGRFEATNDRPEGCIRCHFSEASAVESAVRHLLAAGHKGIGCPALRVDWEARRQAMLVSCIHAVAPQVAAPAPPFRPRAGLVSLPVEGIVAPLARLHRRGIAPLRAFIGARAGIGGKADTGYRGLAETIKRGGLPQRFFAFAPSLAACLREPAVTALVAPNDILARHLWEWLELAGIRIPRDLSLISFDDSHLLHPFPVSSVNFGFDNLGYSAFHAIHEGVPVRRARNGDVAARAHVADRGSVAAPPRRSVWRRFVGEVE